MPFGTMMIGEAGEWMVGYQFMFDDIDGSLVGTNDISISQILKRFPAAPTDMTMKMHMVMAMYSPPAAPTRPLVQARSTSAVTPIRL